jgi:hypothetical protein
MRYVARRPTRTLPFSLKAKWRGISEQDGTERECEGEFSLLNPHICRVAQSATSSARSSGSSKSSNKRKRKTVDDESVDGIGKGTDHLLMVACSMY